MSPAALITRGFDIKAAVPGGLWVQKDREVYFCNSGRALDNDVLCWRLREPVKGQVCQKLIPPEVQLIHKTSRRLVGTPRCLGEFGRLIVDKCVECAGACGVGRAGIFPLPRRCDVRICRRRRR